MDIQQAVAENIHRIRKAQRLSIDRAAELSGVSKSMWGQIERGGANPTVSVLSRMAQGLHVPLEQLIACHDDPPTMLHRAVDVTGQRLCGGKVIAYRLFPFDPESRSESVQLDLFISGSYDGPDRVPGSWIYVTSLSGTVEVTTGRRSVPSGESGLSVLPGQPALSLRKRRQQHGPAHSVDRV